MVFWKKFQYLLFFLILLSFSFFYPNNFYPHFFLPHFFYPHLLKSWLSGKFSDWSEILHLLQIFQFIWFNWKKIHLLHSVWKEFSKMLGKWKIFRFVGKVSSNANIPIDRIFDQKWKIFHLLQMFQYIWFYWKNFHLLH